MGAAVFLYRVPRWTTLALALAVSRRDVFPDAIPTVHGFLPVMQTPPAAVTGMHARPADLLRLYHTLVLARRVDELEKQFTARGEAFFHVSGYGHAASAALAPHLKAEDYLHCHYRDKALMLARGLPVEQFFLSLFCKADSHSRGRQMSAHLSDPVHHILSIVGPVGNNALQAVGVASAIVKHPGEPVVVCSMGDGTTQQGEVLEAIGEAVRSHLPVLFLVEDNALAISTTTRGRTFYSLPTGDADSFYGIPIRRINGRSVRESFEHFADVVSKMRESRLPAIVIMESDRLDHHTNADDQTTYRSPEDIAKASADGDPVAILARDLLQAGYSQEELNAVVVSAHKEADEAAEIGRTAAEPKACTTAKAPLPPELLDPSAPASVETTPSITMLEAMREVLRHNLQSDEKVVLYGQDIDDPKGDVFGLTRGLGRAFPGRVQNAPLAESTIVGVSIGRALAGMHPVAFLQFADFIPIAFNQIASELATMYWRTDGGWQAPVIVMAVCGGFRAGLGPFHAQTLESIVAHTPGLDVMMPSNAEDAAGLLNAAFKSRRPTIFLYPKSCLNDRSLARAVSPSLALSPLGKARVVRPGKDVTLVGWGSTVAQCMTAAEHLAGADVNAEVLDLRCLSPWDVDSVVESARRTGHLVVAHEDNLSAGFGAEVLARVLELAPGHVRALRVARPDSHIPCNYANQLEILPGADRIVEAAAKLLDLEIRSTTHAELPEDLHLQVVEAFGTSPSDEQVTVIHWLKQPGAQVRAGDTIAEIEADKAAGELATPFTGTIEELLVQQGQPVKVGTPLFTIRTEAPRQKAAMAANSPPRLPEVRRRRKDFVPSRVLETSASGKRSTVYLAAPHAATGTAALTNDELVAAFPHVSADDIDRKIGIERRCKASSDEDALSLALRAVESALQADPHALDNLDMIICSTSTVSRVCPSLACSIQAHLLQRKPDLRAQAFDMLATCAGYLYGLQIAHDFLQQSPASRVLLVTTEHLAPLLDPQDFGSCISFADAATATLLGTNSTGCVFELSRPLTFAQGDGDLSLTVPPIGQGTIKLDGRAVRRVSVPGMVEALRAACQVADITPQDLRYLVAHQANQRVLEELGELLAVAPERVFSNIRNLGNTSSSTLPLCLRDLSDQGLVRPGDILGLTAFGGGFTYGGAILRAC